MFTKEGGTRIGLKMTPRTVEVNLSKEQPRYYLWTSGVMGWVATTMHLYTASSPLGAFNASGANGTDQGCPIGILAAQL